MSHTTTTTTIQDRTPEFRSILTQAQKSLARQHRNAQRPPSSQQQSQPLLPQQQQHQQQNGTATPPTRKQRSEFARNAAQIGRGISATMGKLQRLGELAKRKTLFDDRPVEIAELTYIIKQDLAGLNQQIGSLQQLSRGVAAAPQGQEEEHNKNVVVLLQGKLADVSVNFKEVLEVRTRNIQASRSRQDNFVSSVGGAAAAPQQQQQQGQQGSTLDPGRTDSPLYQTPSRGRSPKPGESRPGTATAPSTSNPGDVVLSLDQPSTNNALYPHQGGGGGGGGALLQEQQQQLQQPDNSYIQARGEAISSIEATINELGSIFTQLSTMVSEQAEQIQRIDANTDDVVDNVGGAQRELMKYWGRVQGNRWLVAKLFGVLMVFFLLWVLVAG